MHDGVRVRGGFGAAAAGVSLDGIGHSVDGLRRDRVPLRYGCTAAARARKLRVTSKGGKET